VEVKPIRSALLSVFHKQGLDRIAQSLHAAGVQLYSTGGTASYLQGLGCSVHEISDITGYPSILGGRVKTLHPAVFGGILARQSDPAHLQDMEAHGLPFFDLVVVDLYPFEKTLEETDDEATIIEKIDIGGVSLIRAGAKNYRDVAIVASQAEYDYLAQTLEANGAATSLADRRYLAGRAFAETMRYDTAIAGYMAGAPLRYGENPHQQAHYIGNADELYELLGGKALSYNNLLDMDAALRAIRDFDPGTFVIIKHTNACGIATGNSAAEAYSRALACDPVSAFGGILITNLPVDLAAAQAMHSQFFEVLLAPQISTEALALLQQKANRRIIRYKHLNLPRREQRSILNGLLVQETDRAVSTPETLEIVTGPQPDARRTADLLMGERCAKQLKSNAIAIVKDGQMIGAGCGQTSRIDALNQAIDKARRMGFDLKDAILASDGFFPFSDGVAAAHAAGIRYILQPGGSVRDQETIDYCNQQGLTMAITGTRHFRH
jgi:phosphoribosylaminoimidazolecarboxamide formyltransferase/IMP cyclohydrolase